MAVCVVSVCVTKCVCACVCACVCVLVCVCPCARVCVSGVLVCVCALRVRVCVCVGLWVGVEWVPTGRPSKLQQGPGMYCPAPQPDMNTTLPHHL